MEKVITLLNKIPFWFLFSAALLLAVLITAFILYVFYRRKVRKFTAYLEEALENNNFSNEIYPSSFVKRHSKEIGNFAVKNGNRIIYLTGLDRMWLRDLYDKPTVKRVEKILKFIPETGLFSCFLSALKKPALGAPLLEYIGDEPGSLRKLPLSGSIETFDGNAGRLLFAQKMDEIREMAGDPEWSVRYFAVKLLLNEDSDRSKRGLLEAFDDPHPLIRKSVIEECYIDNREKIYVRLKKHLLDDPSFEVRKSAYMRIIRDFADIHTIEYSSLSAVEALHVLDFLNSNIEADIDAALGFLEGEDLELRFPAALFLQETGVLGRMLNGVSFEDTKNLERTTILLKNAAEVKITGFLKEQIESTASLYTALSILKSTGERTFIADYAEKIFNQPEKPEDRVWRLAVECVRERPSDSSIKILLDELKKQKDDKEKTSFILHNLPQGIEHLSFQVLMDLLKDNNFNYREALLDALSAIPEDTVIPELFEILREGREKYSHRVRISALQILARYKLPYCIQPIIEQLPTLPAAEAKEFSALLSDFAGETFDKRALDLLKQPDSQVRAAVIASLPGTRKKEFLKPIKDAFNDADPDVRIASIWALADYEEGKLLNQSFDMLRDPVERVRVAAAEILGHFGSADKLVRFSELLRDENEVDEVKRAAIKGLVNSDQNKAVDILIELIDENEALEPDAVKALSRKPSKKTFTRIIENMKDASPVLRDKIMNVFKLMGESGEEALKKLLTEDIASLKESITSILEATGYVEHIIRKLSHRDRRIRKSAAEFLSMMGTKSAFRGIVLAARDPDQDVRVEVTRALEKLSSKSGEEILEALKNDPDKRVRKFTAWALARTKAKAIED